VSTSAIKAGLIALFTAAVDPATTVDYANIPRQDVPTEWVYLGEATSVQAHHAFRGGGRLPRQVTTQIAVHVKVRAIGQRTAAENDARADAIGDQLETPLVVDPTLATVVGAKSVLVTARDLAPPSVDDDGLTSHLALTVTVMSVET